MAHFIHTGMLIVLAVTLLASVHSAPAPAVDRRSMLIAEASAWGESSPPFAIRAHAIEAQHPTTGAPKPAHKAHHRHHKHKSHQRHQHINGGRAAPSLLLSSGWGPMG